ncbi:BatD family protein [Luteibacter aegosomatissinici]|uniref:BatD family protein n=1 Tax=Luteibacter aegosomatissinici TaxID=2911539 RepID=UPI001FF99E9F|nr:BatD family protein [Luteibacter aegosomatissinici]UPG95067.1 BatD family protein [Luteibacter aegosomatissinici]
MMMRQAWLALALSLVVAVAHAQPVAPVASLDRTRVGVSETVTLNIEVADDNLGNPDLSPLAADFFVLGTSTNHSLSIVNGKREAHTILGIALRPKHEGQVTVPALSIGGQLTQPLPLSVEATSHSPADAANRPVVLEGKVDPATGYVGQQFDYTLRLYFAVNLADGQLGDPSAEGAEIRRIGSDANFQTERGGRRFNVVERHYAIIPQHAGSLEIKPPGFQGTAVDPTDVNSFFGAGEPVNAVAQPVSVEVQSRPASAPDGAWLPARSLTLSLDGFPADGKARVGQPMTLAMRLDATGLPFEALPALSLPKLDGADVYPDKAVTGSSTNGPWITGRRQQGFAVVPTHAGRLHIPETTLHWWNVTTDKPETAVVPARDIEVAPAIGGAPVTSPGTPAMQPQASPATPVATERAAVTGLPWPAIAAGMAILWLLTVAIWVVSAKHRRRVRAEAPVAAQADPVRPRAAREDFLRSLASGDVITIERALLSWARSIRPEVRILGDLAKALRPGEQRDAISALQRARFGGGALDTSRWREVFDTGFDWAPPAGPADNGGLPPLYPR